MRHRFEATRLHYDRIMPNQSSVPSPADEPVRQLIGQYIRRAELLRQIHSNKANRVSGKSRILTIVTVLVATVVTLLGFMGTTRLSEAVSLLLKLPPETAEMIYSLIVLLILVLTILGLIFRFDERSTRHYNSVEVLTEFIRDYEDLVALSRSKLRTLTQHDLSLARTRYKGIIARLPPNTDKEYLKAKKSSRKKEAAKTAAQDQGKSAIGGWVDDSRSQLLDSAKADRLAVLLSSPAKMSVLSTVRDVLGEDVWVTGGFLRETVWDAQHGFTIPSPLDDLDVVFFDKQQIDQERDKEMAQALHKKSPNVRWSVKNEARMHVASEEEPYISLLDAVSRFPETASALAARVDSDNVLHLIAPHGVDDLFDLVLRPTTTAKMSRVEERIAVKQWEQKWPKLRRANTTNGTIVSTSIRGA